MRVNSLLVARNFDVKQKHILIGNGATELIKGPMEHIAGKVGFIRPPFEEYPNRWDVNQSVIFESEDARLRYTVDNLTAYFKDKEIGTFVLVNPDNPSGNCILKEDIMGLIVWCKECEIRLVLDESFVDFAEEEDATAIKGDVLFLYEGLVIIKSISKSYGMPASG